MPVVLISPEETGVPDARWTKLCGFSGCKVFLIEHNGQRFVRKIAKDTAYNDRLIQQKEKQQKFKGSDGGFLTAGVLREGTMPSGLYYFDMDFLSGESAARALGTLPLSRIKTWSRTFLAVCPTKHEGFLSHQIFRDKIAALKASLAAFHAHELINAAMTRLDQAAWTDIPQTPCHGDLTFENMVIHENRFHLVDFLDSFADSWFMDAAKLMQDLYGRWSFRHVALSHNTELRLLALRERVEAGWAERHKDCLPAIRDIYILNLLRILPYCSTIQEKESVEDMLNEALKRR